jgi:hypothetical protein
MITQIIVDTMTGGHPKLFRYGVAGVTSSVSSGNGGNSDTAVLGDDGFSTVVASSAVSLCAGIG